MACLGPFCGYFRDDLEGSGSDDDEIDDGKIKASSMMTGKKKKVRKWMSKASKEDAPSSSGSAKMRWAQYLHQANVSVKVRGSEMVQQVVELRVDNARGLTPGMMKCISQLPKLHSIEITRCQILEVPPLLGELDSLVILRLSHNRLRKFSEELATCLRIEQIILDWNDIGDIGPGIFSTRSFPYLEVVNVSHNALSSLPSDFGVTSKSNIRHIDLSTNNLQSIPPSILTCRFLEELNLSHNRLKQLPGGFKELKRLQKLFVSFNELTCLPSDIGGCMALTNIRIISNQIKELPDSIIDLWPKKPGGKGGKLKQFLVERNPMVMPSITAFEMDDGGIDRAFQLFYEHVCEKKLQQKLATQQEAVKAIEDQKLMALQDAKKPGDNRRVSFSTDPSVVEDAEMHQEEEGDEDPTARHLDYYFAHCNKDPEQIAQIRDAESTMLLIKKNMFLAAQKVLAKEAEEDAGDIDDVPDNLKLFLEDGYQEKYTGIVPVRDLDLYFSLLVFSMKPQFPTLQLLFIKYEDGDKGYLIREEWNEFCMCVPIYLDDVVRDQMWQLMAFRRSDRVQLHDFVAAWHIHDIEAQDPWIARMAKVLSLDYYDMNVKELHDRLHGKTGQDATPQLDFDQPVAAVTELDDVMPKADQGDALSDVLGSARSTNGVVKERRREVLDKVTLTDAQYYQQNRAILEAEGESQASDEALDNQELSESSDSEISEFDAWTALRQQEAEQQALNVSTAAVAGRLVIDSDEAIHKLMELPLEDFFAPTMHVSDAPSGSSHPLAKAKAAKRPEEEDDDRGGASKKKSTIVVMRALRQVHRSMPHCDFVSLINYLLRVLREIKHKGGNTYWHADDPAFKQVMGAKGTNEYTRGLFAQLGFMKLSEVHWVWPSPIFDTPYRVISKHVDKNRLDDMICLLKSCQMNLHKTGRAFTGRFALLH